MKARSLFARHDVVISNYRISQIVPKDFLHQFETKTTGTSYEFTTTNSAPIMVDGERYNIGFEEEGGKNIVEPAALSKISDVNPIISLMTAKQISKENDAVNRGKNDARVTHSAPDGYYWGKKYAWRQFGLVISKGAFYAYLEEIGHPKIDCITSNPDMSYANEPSIAFKDNGLEAAIDELIYNAKPSGSRYFTSPRYSKKFQIRGINAITDKK